MGVGDACTGSGDSFPYLTRAMRGAGNCPEMELGVDKKADLRCYVGQKHAASGEAGVCKFARHKPCRIIDGEEDGCRQGTFCREFHYHALDSARDEWYPTSGRFCAGPHEDGTFISTG